MAVSPETLVAVAGLAVCGAAVATVAGLAGPAVPLAGVAAAALLAIPTTAALRAWLVDVLLDRGDAARARAVAARAHAAARRPHEKARAAADLAVVHLAAASADAAVPLLEEATASLPAPDRPAALALLAIALLHRQASGGDPGSRDATCGAGPTSGDTSASGDLPPPRPADLDRPLALARQAAAAAPDDALVAHALGLALLARGEAAAALPHLRRGAAEGDAGPVPSPRERLLALARAHAALGEDDAAEAVRLAAVRFRQRS